MNGQSIILWPRLYWAENFVASIEVLCKLLPPKLNYRSTFFGWNIFPFLIATHIPIAAFIQNCIFTLFDTLSVCGNRPHSCCSYHLSLSDWLSPKFCFSPIINRNDCLNATTQSVMRSIRPSISDKFAGNLCWRQAVSPICHPPLVIIVCAIWFDCKHDRVECATKESNQQLP